jgi:hypothetical protein
MLTNWEKAGKPQVGDMHPIGNAGDNRWFNTANPPIQRTWGRLIRAVLHANGQEVSNNTIRQYQRHKLGRPGGETCLIELMPLPAPGINNWRYDEISNLPILKSRKAYMDGLCPERVRSLRHLIQKQQPKVVVFYSTSYFKYWKEVVGVEKAWTENGCWKTLEGDKTRFYCIQHPTYYPVRDELYDKLGYDMRSALAE